MKECDCEDWNNIKGYLQATNILTHSHCFKFGGKEKPFVYCPYCRKKLKGD